MLEVKGSDGKLVCKLDPDRKIVQIANKGKMTEIEFHKDGSVEIRKN